MRDQEIIGLWEAYQQVHSQLQEVEQLDENVQDAVKGALKSGAEFMKTNPVGKAVSNVIAPVGGGRKTPTATSGGYRKEEVDLFDTILEHLVAEGYADTNEAALAIMVNMSEEWRQSIVEVLDTPEKANEYGKKALGSMLGAATKAVLTKDKKYVKTVEKRTEGAKMAKRKAERKAAEES